ncbi:MAG: type II toxin-antitoxin system death-on-curing family toxin [Methylotenera sp.]|nr:type II toxin-antitoxin system death-on-curing family toxin [Oligoflexia bacterium]
MRETLFPTFEEAVELHKMMVERFGGAPGIRDAGLLESALARPRSGYYSSLSEQAAALMHSLAMNHCFVDGNKRMAFGLTAVFLRINGFRLHVSPDEGESFLIHEVIIARKDVSEIKDWIERFLA